MNAVHIRDVLRHAWPIPCEVSDLISYRPFFETLQRQNETTYTLISRHNVSSSLINRLRNNRPVSTTTVNDLCILLNCSVGDILEYIPSQEDMIRYL